MTIIHLPNRPARDVAPGAASGGQFEDAAIVGELAPLLEGARARGVADAFEATGQGAILLGGSGEILHLTSAARRLTAGLLRVRAGHLLGDEGLDDSTRVNRALARIIGDALSGGDGVETILEVGAVRLAFRAVAFPGGSRNARQLLKAFLLVDAAPLAN